VSKPLKKLLRNLILPKGDLKGEESRKRKKKIAGLDLGAMKHAKKQPSF